MEFAAGLLREGLLRFFFDFSFDAIVVVAVLVKVNEQKFERSRAGNIYRTLRPSAFPRVIGSTPLCTCTTTYSPSLPAHPATLSSRLGAVFDSLLISLRLCTSTVSLADELHPGVSPCYWSQLPSHPGLIAREIRQGKYLLLRLLTYAVAMQVKEPMRRSTRCV